ncbi:MAG TPA: ATP-binding protein, partial [Chitinophagaceae bacterium]|nr:ATP-binding protein [Chitinophagaceae bacterium]
LNWFNIQFEVTGSPVFMDAQKELFIFRIIQEAFNNILKHSQASIVKMQLHYNNDHLEIAVTDNGVGFIRNSLQNETAIQTGAGLRNMQKRANLLNGYCNIESNLGAGTTVKLKIPF